jgi:hypothetical protein
MTGSPWIVCFPDPWGAAGLQTGIREESMVYSCVQVTNSRCKEGSNE